MEKEPFLAYFNGMKAIIYDCDGVLVDSELIYKSSERMFLKNVGLVYETQEFFRRFMGRSEKSFFEEAEKDHMALHGRSLPGDFRPGLLAYQEEAFETQLAAITGMEQVIESFLHVPYAVASSSPTKSLKYKLAKTGLLDHFGDHIYSAEMVAHGKPEPDLFLYTADKINMATKDCIVVEDSANGVIAGVRAGMTIIGFCGGGHCPEGHEANLMHAGASKVAMTPDELKTMIKSLLTP